MLKNAASSERDTEEQEDSGTVPLTAEEAAQWRSRNPSLSMWWVIAGQVVVGGLVALVAWAVSGRSVVAWSAAYGALSVVVPSALFAYGLRRPRAVSSPAALAAGFLGWEIVKIMLTVAMLAAARKVVPGLSWLALLAGLVVTMKMYWIAFAVRARTVVKPDLMKEKS